MKQLSLILIGGGDRGSSYLKYLDSNSDKFRFVSIASGRAVHKSAVFWYAFIFLQEK